MDAIEAYPLYWPSNKPRTKYPQKSRFDTSFTWARTQLLDEVRLLGGKDVIISSNIPLRRDGLPYANHKKPDDTGIAVYFKYNGQDTCFTCDKWIDVADNLHAIGKTINALRGINRWGGDDTVQAAFRGFQALPAPDTKRSWHEILSVPPNASKDKIKRSYRRLAKLAHPDNGGSAEQMAEINRAYKEAI